jgi:hypothetical protein
MSDPDLVQNFLFIVYRTHYLKCTVEVRNLRSDFFSRLLEKKGKNVGHTGNYQQSELFLSEVCNSFRENVREK